MTRTLSYAVCIALATMAAPAFALTDSETNASIPFSFANPGARSLGMGGAFIGLADDATAAYTNPAGLVQPRQTEVSAEVRHTGFDLPFVNGGTGIASGGRFDGSGVNGSDADSSTTNLSFLSVLFPRDRWSFALYRHELLNYDADYSSSGVFVGFPDACETCGGNLRPFDASSSIEVVNYGVSGAWKVSDRVSLGAGLSWYDFDIHTTDTRFVLDDAGLPTSQVANQQVQRGSDSGFGMNLGALFQLTDRWSLGLVYRHVPEFDYRATGMVGPDFDAELLPPVIVSNAKFNVPDSFGAGLSFRPSDTLVLNLDLNYVRYSELSDSMDTLFYSIENDGSMTFNDPSVLQVSNGTEIHLGGEYTFIQFAHPFSVRLGTWYDPAHALEYHGALPTDGSLFSQGQVGLASLFSQGSGSQMHYAGGLGFAFSKFQLDFAFDLSDEIDTYSLSGVYRF